MTGCLMEPGGFTMTLQQLIYFQTIAQEQNFTRAAEILCITKPFSGINRIY